MTDNVAVWGEREQVRFKAAREIQETGQVFADTYMKLREHEITPEQVARALVVLNEQAEENE